MRWINDDDIFDPDEDEDASPDDLEMDLRRREANEPYD